MRCALKGCGAVADASGVLKNTVDLRLLLAVAGLAVNRVTLTVNACPSPSGLCGVMISSSSLRVNAADWPLTETPATLWPPQSRSKCERDCVARARIVTSPSTDCDGSLVA